MGIITTINRSLIAFDAFARSVKKGKIDNKTVIIVFQQLFGDSVLIQDSLGEYTKVFPASEGYELIFLARPSVLAFMKKVLPLPDGIVFDSIDFKKYLSNYRYYRSVVRKYCNLAGVVVVPGSSLSGFIFSAVSNAKRRIGLVRPMDIKKPWIMSKFAKLAFNETVRTDKRDMMLARHKKLINYICQLEGIKAGYKTRIPHLLMQRIVIEGRYVVLCPGASKMEKCWPINRFIEVSDYIVEKYRLPIHLCGGQGEEKFFDVMILESKHRNQIISHIGKTEYSDWSSIVQHASLVIGNDSATMHLAAAARVPSVCIAGAYDKYEFFPYQVDVLKTGDSLPVTLLKDMPCEWCRTIGYDAGYGNEECGKRIKAGLCCSCIDLITVDEVKTAIDRLMKEERK